MAWFKKLVGLGSAARYPWVQDVLTEALVNVVKLEQWKRDGSLYPTPFRVSISTQFENKLSEFYYLGYQTCVSGESRVRQKTVIQTLNQFRSRGLSPLEIGQTFELYAKVFRTLGEIVGTIISDIKFQNGFVSSKEVADKYLGYLKALSITNQEIIGFLKLQDWRELSNQIDSEPNSQAKRRAA
jgi:hypothetical protein